MNYSVEIIKVDAGEARICDGGAWGDHTRFWWTQGNGRCDCNRDLFWNRAAVPDYDADDDDPAAACGHTRYRVTRAILDNGSEIAIDAPEGDHE